MNLIPLQEILGHSFSKPELLVQALTHRSFANEENASGGKKDGDNERLEFLGDAVLDLAMSSILMQRFPQDTEGALSKKRASLVNEDTLSQIALELGLNSHLRLGKGEVKTGGLTKPRILASTVEAVLGASYQDCGFEKTFALIERYFETRLDEMTRSSVDYRTDFKTRLQELVQEKKKSTPVYQVESESGPDHDKSFAVAVQVFGEVLAVGNGKSKKAAEQDAARQALMKEEENAGQ